MIALTVSLLIFAYFLVLGLGITALLPSSYSTGTRLRLSPGIGIGLYLIFAIGLSRFGLPVKSFVFPLATGLFVVSLIAIVRCQPRPSLSQVAGIVGPIVVAIVLVGSPMITFGYHWLSFANNDMTNYALTAQRFSENGYFTPPGPETYEANKEMNRYFGWKLAVVGGERSGVDILLASASSVAKINPVEMFMPLIFSGFLSIVLAAGALGLSGKGELLPFLISLAVAASPLSAFGLFYQLLGQEFGLACLCTTAALIVGPDRYSTWPTLVRTAIVTSVASSGLVANYPELLPFLALGIFIWLSARRQSIEMRWQIAKIGLASIGVFVLLNAQAVAMLHVIANRVHVQVGIGKTTDEMFPYYLIPSGIANLWGLQPIASFYADPQQSILIAIALILTLGALATSIILVLSEDAGAAPVLLAFVAYAIVAAMTSQGFSLYKIAMYVQPFMLAVVASGVWLAANRIARISHSSQWIAIASPMALLIAAGLPALFVLRDDSVDRHSGLGAAFTEIALGSVDGVTRSLDSVSSAARGIRTDITSDTSSVVLARLESVYLAKQSLDFTSYDFLGGIKPTDDFRVRLTSSKYSSAELFDYDLSHARSHHYEIAKFNFDPGRKIPVYAAFVIEQRTRPANALLFSSHDLDIVNRDEPLPQKGTLAISPLRSMQGHLTFITTTIGSSGSIDRRHASLFELERDYFSPDLTMASIGRYLLFAYDGKPGPIRLVLDISASLAQDGRNFVPPATAVGTRRVSFHAVGRGSARLISDPVEPVLIDGRPYIGIDMGPRTIQFVDHRTGLMRLYGGWVRADSRDISGFARDISVAPPSVVADSNAPVEISNFPRDFDNPAFFYSGLYEDGWMSDDARLRLAAPKNGSHLKFSILVPLIKDTNFSTSVTIDVDGRTIGTWPTPVGESTIEVPKEFRRGDHVVRLQFESGQALPGLDRRIVAGRLTSVGFE